MVAVALLLSGLYVSSYLPLVERDVLRGDLISLEHEVTYRVGGEYAHTLFRPLHVMDRKLRPTYWQWNDPAIRVELAETSSIDP